MAAAVIAAVIASLAFVMTQVAQSAPPAPQAVSLQASMDLPR